jgi:protein-tyrosine phosphatase
MTSVLVVCIANICRSPIGEAYFKRFAPHLRVASAGINAMTGHHADPKSVQVCAEQGIDISSHRATMLSAQLIAHADYVLVMDRQMSRIVKNKYPIGFKKVFMIGESLDIEIDDPFGKSVDQFRDAANKLESGVQSWIKKFGK